MKLWALGACFWIGMGGGLAAHAGNKGDELSSEMLKKFNCLVYRTNLNVNANVPLRAYAQPNDRPLRKYQATLGFPPPPAGSVAIDVGGGRGVAFQELARNGVTAIVINTQDVRSTFDEQTLQLIRDGRFTFMPGYAEKVLPELKNRAQILTDLWGAFPYSATRDVLIQMYYAALKPGGKAYVLLPDGVEDDLVLHEGVPLFFSQYLKVKFPSVFQIRPRSTPTAIQERVLVIEKGLEGPAEIDLGLRVQNIVTHGHYSGFVIPAVLYESHATPQGP